MSKPITPNETRPQKRSHLREVKTPTQWRQLNAEIHKNVALLVEGDESAHALAFLIDLASGIFSEFSAKSPRASQLAPNERSMCATAMLDEAFRLSCRHTEAMAEWLGLEEKPVVDGRGNSRKSGRRRGQ
jgi:hypothetical protein